MAVFADFGTSWTKIYDLEEDKYKIISSKNSRNLIVDIGTGHNVGKKAKKYVNELTAMALAAQRKLGENNFKILDIGSRDMKYISFKDGMLDSMDWNSTCGAFTGFTVELLGRYYALDFSKIRPAKEAISVTCGVLGMERLFDLVASGVSVKEAMARFVRGVAKFAHDFIDRPGKFYLSGGMCDNPLFMASFPEGVEVIPMGRFLLVEGLIEEI